MLSLHTPKGDVATTLRIPGAHNVRNAQAASAAALAAGAPLAAIVNGLQAFEPVKGRSAALTLPWRGGRLEVVDDSYNANPDSVLAAIEVLASMAAPRWLVLGDMGEVGDRGPDFHTEVGARARACALESFWCAGTLSRHAATGLRPGGAPLRRGAGPAPGAADGTAGGVGAGQGLAFHEDGAGGPGPATGVGACCLACRNGC